ncbi:MAG: hypothetical protein [Olavius algarvensis Gamma 3 endosymbiont]|nr:MAG: hypothetical protein [Olavius algarvensis Gamma 3 endosymbiont]
MPKFQITTPAQAKPFRKPNDSFRYLAEKLDFYKIGNIIPNINIKPSSQLTGFFKDFWKLWE